jgi:hypothetical protein
MFRVIRSASAPLALFTLIAIAIRGGVFVVVGEGFPGVALAADLAGQQGKTIL